MVKSASRFAACLIVLALFPALPALRATVTEDSLAAGIRYFENGALDSATTFFENRLRLQPEDAQAHYFLGRISFAKNELDAAEKHLLHAIRLEPGDSRFHTWLGTVYGNKINSAGFFSKYGIAKKIKFHFSRAVELDADNLEAREGLILFLMRAPAIVGGSIDKAKEHARVLKSIDLLRGSLSMARIYEKEKKWPQAEAEYAAAVKELPHDDKARLQLGYFYQRQKKYAQAFAIFEDMLADSLNSRAALYQIGKTGALSGQNLDRAIACFQQYLQLKPGEDDPSWADAHWRMGMIYEHRQQYNKARQHYRSALALEPDHRQARAAIKKLK